MRATIMATLSELMQIQDRSVSHTRPPSSSPCPGRGTPRLRRARNGPKRGWCGRSTGAAQEENSPVLHPISEEEGWHRHGKSILLCSSKNVAQFLPASVAEDEQKWLPRAKSSIPLPVVRNCSFWDLLHAKKPLFTSCSSIVARKWQKSTQNLCPDLLYSYRQ